MTSDVGYKKPPKATQFAKGRSGNPSGRPKGSVNFSTLLEKELAAAVVITEGGRRKKVTRMQAMAKRLVADALQGDHKALLALLEVLRKTGQLNHTEKESALPGDYESILDSYVRKRTAKPPTGN